MESRSACWVKSDMKKKNSRNHIHKRNTPSSRCVPMKKSSQSWPVPSPARTPQLQKSMDLNNLAYVETLSNIKQTSMNVTPLSLATREWSPGLPQFPD